MHTITEFAKFRSTFAKGIPNAYRGVPLDDRNDHFENTVLPRMMEIHNDKLRLLSTAGREDVFKTARFKHQAKIKGLYRRIKKCNTRLAECKDDFENSMTAKLTASSSKRIRQLQSEIANLTDGGYCPKLKVADFPFATDRLIQNNMFTGLLTPVVCQFSKVTDSISYIITA